MREYPAASRSDSGYPQPPRNPFLRFLHRLRWRIRLVKARDPAVNARNVTDLHAYLASPPVQYFLWP